MNRVSRPTTRPGSETTDLKVGDRVRAARAMPPTGSWKRYNGREGTVVVLNRQRFPSGVTYCEVGVAFGPPPVDADRLEDMRADAWFRADELERVLG